MEIEFKNDKTRAQERMEGSDGRANVSSRSDGRRYYNSRDEGQTYALVWEHVDTQAGECVMYIKNTSTTKTLVVSSIGLNSAADTRFRLSKVEDQATGTVVTPTNANGSSGHDANALTLEGGALSTGITGLSVVSHIDQARCKLGGHEEFRLNDTLRLGQNDSVAVYAVSTSGGDTDGVAYFFFE